MGCLFWGGHYVVIYGGSCRCRSILGAPDCWKLPDRDSIMAPSRDLIHRIHVLWALPEMFTPQSPPWTFQCSSFGLP